ncbi:sigma-70 family RNA polymerase sigma factor [Streptomyces sp. NPDC088752]|uniref:RNA polymerase sigma factor n=1 Tax=Streptomyces sp. NPDC088752 TaxID=3154963 RepID=UPI00343026EB
MNVDNLPYCLGCSDESDRQHVVFPTAPDGSRIETPTGLYGDQDRWCKPCWIFKGPFERFEFLYGQRLRSYTRGRLRHLPGGAREMAVDDVTSEVMEVLWRRRDRIEVPERAMYRTAFLIAQRRFPLSTKEAPMEAADMQEDVEDPMDELIDLILLEEELKKLPPRTRQYLYDHKGLGESAEDVGRRHGVKKSTVTESTRRGLEAVRPAFDYIHYVALVAEAVRWILHMLW